MQIDLTEVEVCTIRTALRRMAEQTPLRTDGQWDCRDYRRLADRLDPLVAATITQRRAA